MEVIKEFTNITLQEVPNHISLNISIAGCGLNCKNCHSPEMQKLSNEKLTEDYIKELLKKYGEYISCVTFFNGDNYKEKLLSIITLVKEVNKDLKICLYTGRTVVDKELLDVLDFLKIGEFNEKLGGLASPLTNQRFIDVKNNKDITNLFWKNKEKICSQN